MKNQPLELFTSKTPKVYKNKKLNNANFSNFTLNDYQVFLYLISKIGGVDEFGKYLQSDKLQREHTLTVKEFSEVFNSGIDNSYRILKKACQRLMKTSITLEKNELKENWEINICSTAKYNKQAGSITIEFTDSVMPYLAQVRERFVLYNLKEISNFSSLYTTYLYELLQEFKDTGYAVKSVEQLRDIFGVGKSFKLYGDFKRYTFDHACQEINNNYKMNLEYEEIKKGRKVVAVKFFFKKTKIYKAVNKKTGVEKNLYCKPEPQLLKNKTKKFKSVEAREDKYLMKNIISRIFRKLKQN